MGTKMLKLYAKSELKNFLKLGKLLQTPPSSLKKQNGALSSWSGNPAIQAARSVSSDIQFERVQNLERKIIPLEQGLLFWYNSTALIRKSSMMRSSETLISVMIILNLSFIQLVVGATKYVVAYPKCQLSRDTINLFSFIWIISYILSLTA
jgi:hypothetical protein